MPKSKMASGNINTSTQQYLDIAEIKENTVIMRDSTMRAVIMVSSINFALKSEDEQNAIVSSYVSFLNNIDFPLQIIIQSRELNIDNYLASLKQKEKEQTNELLKIQTAEYGNYIKELVAISRIMNKRFYVIVPYNPANDKQKSFFSRFLDILKPATVIQMKEEKFMRRRVELTHRIDSIISGLNSMSLNAVELDTQGLIELYYNSYNPETSLNEKLTNTNDLRVAK
jgi:hypothetical protein